ncbi:hypothetical protein BN85412710 [Alteracholeplasma palmae J233]|uniref:Uncharacterized protein n=1 Tax=Alteracholeplasma palmae (strain ATCC 49389 / J233) TaxID=1318466 RepID=U4KLR2_ALTPJ|nr:hypothetical protein [Alteracholeplasma palmae]CCV64848.1 hypothetical protein BN85412710 [Alteracholeplasma palmae J233]
MSQVEVYNRLFRFLEKVYSDKKIDDLGLLLGDMRILDDGKSADPAILNDWEKYFNKEIYDDEMIYTNIVLFLEEYACRIKSQDLKDLITYIKKGKKAFMKRLVNDSLHNSKA